MDEKIKQLKGRLIVSCQALPEEPLHSSYIMGRMAVAAKEGGAYGIRSNSIEDIRAIKAEIDLPVIGIIKHVTRGCPVFITPTMVEVDALQCVHPEIIALDATLRPRPDGKSLDEFYADIRKAYPNQLLMADCATVEEALHADALGFDFLGTTLVGYTDESRDMHIAANDFEIIREILAKAKHPVIAEGNIDTPEKAKRVIDLGCYCVVVGSIITRPQLITKAFAAPLNEAASVLQPA